jgi:hypothetical protein
MEREILTGAIIGAIVVCGYLLLHFWYGSPREREKADDRLHDSDQWW